MSYCEKGEVGNERALRYPVWEGFTESLTSKMGLKGCGGVCHALTYYLFQFRKLKPNMIREKLH